MRAKTVKFFENPFFVCRRGLHALLRWRPYLVDISSDFKTDFFLHWYIMCLCGKCQVEQLFCSNNRHGPVGVM